MPNNKNIEIKYSNTFEVLKNFFLWILFFLPVICANAAIEDTQQDFIEVPVEPVGTPILEINIPIKHFLCDAVMMNTFLKIDFENDRVLKKFFFPPEKNEDETALLMAMGCEKGANIGAMHKLLKSYPHLVNAPGRHEDGVSITPLEYAATHGQTQAVKFLYDNYQEVIDASPSQIIKFGKIMFVSQPMKALLSATLNGHEAVIKYLVQKIQNFSTSDKRQIIGMILESGSHTLMKLYKKLGVIEFEDIELFLKRQKSSIFWHPPLVEPNITEPLIEQSVFKSGLRATL